MMNSTDEAQATIAHRITGLMFDQVQFCGIHCRFFGRPKLKDLLGCVEHDEDVVELDESEFGGTRGGTIPWPFSLSGSGVLLDIVAIVNYLNPG
jgi:hypothetical protein